MFPDKYFKSLYWAPSFWAKVGHYLDRSGVRFNLRSVVVMRRTLIATPVKTFKLKVVNT